MLLTAPVWADGKTPQGHLARSSPRSSTPSRPCPVERLAWVDMPDPAVPDEAVEPDGRRGRVGASGRPTRWRTRRAALAAGAAAVRSAVDAQAEASGRSASARRAGLLPMPGAALPVLEELDLLLEERRRLAAPRRRHRPDAAAPLGLGRRGAGPGPDPVRARRCDARCPSRPALAARRGTAFHAWVEQHFAQAAMVDILDLPGSADDDPGDDADLPRMKERFLASEWAHRTPAEIEIAVETVIDGIAVRGRIDAVFPRAGRRLHDRRLEDRGQAGRAVRRRRARCSSRPTASPSRGCAASTSSDVDAAFYYAATGETVWPDLPDDGALATAARGRARTSASSRAVTRRYGRGL